MCNADARHVVEIIAVLSGTAVFYQEMRYHRARIQSDDFILNNLTAPLGWGLSVILFWIIAIPAYFYTKRSRGNNTSVSEFPCFNDSDEKLILKVFIFFVFAFFFVYKQ